EAACQHDDDDAADKDARRFADLSIENECDVPIRRIARVEPRRRDDDHRRQDDEQRDECDLKHRHEMRGQREAAEKQQRKNASVRTTLTSVKRALGGEREAPILTCSADRLRLQVAKKSCERQRRCNGATDSALYLDTEYAPAPVATRPPPPDAENDR